MDAQGTLVGYVLAGSTPDSGHAAELYGLSVRSLAQGQGVGRCLLRQCANDLLGAGLRSVTLRCLLANPSRPFWERMGARKIGEEPCDWSGVILRAAVYAWDDISVVLS